jgi:hypothetical protein
VQDAPPAFASSAMACGWCAGDSWSTDQHSWLDMACTPVALVFAGDVFSYYHSNIDGKPVCCKVRPRVVCRVVAGAASPTPLAVSREPSLRTLSPTPRAQCCVVCGACVV